MTYEEAFSIVNEDASFSEFKRMNMESDKAYDMVSEACEKADKYRWHDLRKDPNDLPPIAITVMAVVNNEYCAVVRYSEDWCYSHASCLHLLEDDAKVIAWKYIEPYEVAE